MMHGNPMPFGPVRACGPIPPTASRRAPPIHEAMGGYAVRRAQGLTMLSNLDKKTPVECLSVFFSNYCLEKVSFQGDQTPLSMSKVYWPIPESREPLMDALSRR